ncbi:MAG: uracil-DNA glycosylase [Planctomycetes bacterium]|nr:uracil-DNA glycosylase [Planctomycetota bacterium]
MAQLAMALLRYHPVLRATWTTRRMKNMPDVDVNKAVRQHLEMEGFFAGFAVRGKAEARTDSAPADAASPVAVPAPSPARASDSQSMIASPPAPTLAHSPESEAEAVRELQAIAAEVDQCRKCQLGSMRKHSVPGEGHPRARIMFIGEAPGADEDTQGRPFVGRAGQLLDKIIAACGLRRDEVFIGNILKCRPPENREPRPEEIINCLPYLQKQIETINPDIIVALGGHAAKTLLNTVKPIGQLRGQFHEYCTGIGRPSIKLMATFHPAYLLRNYSEQNRRYVWEDMKKVLAELGLPIPERGRG